jgi:hypothetical protein
MLVLVLPPVSGTMAAWFHLIYLEFLEKVQAKSQDPKARHEAEEVSRLLLFVHSLNHLWADY